MDLFEELVDEHRVIAHVLGAFERFIVQVEAGAEFDQQELWRFVTFFREFADLVHHEKEESLLFPAMEQRGYGRDGAPIAHVRSEHERERRLLFALLQLVVRPGPVSDSTRARLMTISRDFIEFQRQHMKKENELLYPTVRREFSGTELSEIIQILPKAQNPEDRVGASSWLRDLALELEESHPESESASRTA